MKNNKRKGFTLVELLVVIAILAILTTVSILGYTSFTKKAQLSNDQAMIAQMNLTLQADTADGSKYASAGEAINALNANGFNGRYTTFASGYHYAYNLKDNKMYLIDEEQNVVYPKNADKEDLWIIMNKAETDYCSTFKKYVALTNLNDDDINFLNGKNVIVDLAGHFIRNKENVSTDIVATNGLVIGTGITSQGETDNSYEYIETTKEAFKDQTVIENKVVEITQINVRDITDGVVTFKNCYFYGDKQSDNYSFAYLGNAVFENCYFYDFTNNPLNTGESGCESLTIKNCSFINCKKAISIYMSCGANVVIDGCNFYGTTGDGRGNIQLSNYTETNKTSLTIKNCVFHEMNSNQAGLIIIHEGILTSPGTQTADGIYFENNTVLGNTPTSKYVVNDDGKADSAFEPFNDSFREAVRSVFVASVK